MKNAKLIFVSLLFITWGCQHTPELNQEITSHEEELILVGQIDLQGLSAEPYSIWFNQNYKDYTVDLGSVYGIELEDINIKLFLGTWCPDSQLQVPQFYKILTELEFDKSKLEMISLDNHPDRDLQSPQHEEEGLNIEFVPTIIFYRDGVEIGRIVEFPVRTLERDLESIIGKGK
jgi:thiol-disulfide isomerase/thioredoxin